jgi:flavin reductase (DIM6/NTAB) family NADH-FMN oxidoreductase RutF
VSGLLGITNYISAVEKFKDSSHTSTRGVYNGAPIVDSYSPAVLECLEEVVPSARLPRKDRRFVFAASFATLCVGC